MLPWMWSSEEHFDVVVTQAVLYNPDVLISLGADGGCFVDRVRRGDDTWEQWTVLAPDVADRLRGFEQDRLLRSLAFVKKADMAICERVHNYQTATDLGLDGFWDDPEGTDVRLVERSYSLIATDFGQFVLVFCFRFVGGDPAGRASAIRRMCINRAIRANVGQLEFSKRAIRYANSEIERLFAQLQLLDSEYRTSSKAVANPRIHGPVTWIKDDDDLTAFPWFLTGRLSTEIHDIIADQNLIDADHSYYAPEPGKPCCIVANDFGFYCETDERRPMRLELLPFFVFSQASYYKTRQLQTQILSEMGDASDQNRLDVDADSTTATLDRLALSFDRFLLAFGLFYESRITKIKQVTGRTLKEWGIKDSHARLSASIERHRQHALSLQQARAHNDSARQQAILFVIAILQLFTLVSVVADYRQLNPSIGDAVREEAWAIERWLFEMSPWLPRLLFAATIGVTCWHFAPVIRAKLARLGRRFRKRRKVQVSGERQDLPVDRFLEVRPSQLHGRGLWTTRCFRKGETIIQYAGGEVVDILPSDDTTGEPWDDEWNATAGRLHVRRGRGTAYRFINHSRDPNAIVEFDESRGVFRVLSLQDIHSDEEVAIDYRAEPLVRRYLIDRGGYL